MPNSKPFFNRRTMLAIFGLTCIVFVVYQPAYLDYARRDHISFILERSQFTSDWSWFMHAVNYNRTRLNNPGDYLLFRPGFFTFLTLEDIFLRADPLAMGLLSIALHLLAAMLLYTYFKIYFKGPLSFALAAFFASQYAGIEMVTWRHISFYMFGILLSLAGFSIFFSKLKYKYWWGGLLLLGAMMFQEIIPSGVVLTVIVLAVVAVFSRRHLARQNIDLPYLIVALLIASLMYMALDIINWQVLHPPQILNTGDSFTPSWGVFNEEAVNFFHYLGAGTRAVFDPFSIVITWKDFDADYVCFSWDITKDAMDGYWIWAAAGGMMLLTAMALSLRRMARGPIEAADIVVIWASCTLVSFVALFSFTRLTIRHSNYSGISGYYWWFFCFFYMIIVKSLVDEYLNKGLWEKPRVRWAAYALITVIILSQMGVARGTIAKDYDLRFAKQLQQFIHAGQVYFSGHPNACLDTGIITVPQRDRQVYTMPYYLIKYNCGWSSRSQKVHPVRNSQGITTFEPGPYPKVYERPQEF